MKLGKITVSEDLDKIDTFKKNRKSILLETNDENIKILIVWKEKTTIYAVAKEEKIWNIDYDKYTLSDLLGQTINFEGTNYKTIAILSQEDFDNWIYKSSDHLAMETIDEFKWKWINSEIFKVKEYIDWVIWKSVEMIISNIYILLKQGYKVTWKINKNTWKVEPFNWQKFIEKIIFIKMNKWNFDDRLADSYVFEK